MRIGASWLLGILISLTCCASTSSPAQEPEPVWKRFCQRQEIRELIVEMMNSSRELKDKKFKIADFQDVTTLGVDESKQTFSCRGALIGSNGSAFMGVAKVQANDKGTGLDWYDDGGGRGLAALVERPNQMPADQSAFLDILVKARSEYEKAKTEFAKGATRPLRAKDICLKFPTAAFKNWAGKVSNLTTNSEGKGVLKVEIGPSISLRTFNIALADIQTKTMVEPSSKVFTQLGELSNLDQVKLSGSFFSSPIDCFKEGSLSLKGSLTQPEFIVRFDDIRKASN